MRIKIKYSDSTGVTIEEDELKTIIIHKPTYDSLNHLLKDEHVRSVTINGDDLVVTYEKLPTIEAKENNPPTT